MSAPHELLFRPMTVEDLDVVAGWLAQDDREYREACGRVGVGAGTAGIDYLIGDPALTGRGIGTEAVRRYVADVVFARAPWPAVVAGPHPDNRASIRVLEKNGFAFVGEITTSDGPEHMMRITRPTGRAA